MVLCPLHLSANSIIHFVQLAPRIDRINLAVLAGTSNMAAPDIEANFELDITSRGPGFQGHVLLSKRGLGTLRLFVRSVSRVIAERYSVKSMESCK